MLVPFTAVALGGFYLFAVPLKIAFVLRWTNGLRIGFAVAAFEGRVARHAAERRLSAPRPKRKKRFDAARALRSLPALTRAARYLLARTELVVHARFGLGDAALTALLCGAINSLSRAGAAVSGLRLHGGFFPDFHAETAADISGIITVRAGHIMLGALIGAIDWTQGRLRHGQTPH